MGDALARCRVKRLVGHGALVCDLEQLGEDGDLLILAAVVGAAECHPQYLLLDVLLLDDLIQGVDTVAQLYQTAHRGDLAVCVQIAAVVCCHADGIGGDAVEIVLQGGLLHGESVSGVAICRRALYGFAHLIQLHPALVDVIGNGISAVALLPIEGVVPDGCRFGVRRCQSHALRQLSYLLVAQLVGVELRSVFRAGECHPQFAPAVPFDVDDRVAAGGGVFSLTGGVVDLCSNVLAAAVDLPERGRKATLAAVCVPILPSIRAVCGVGNAIGQPVVGQRHDLVGNGVAGFDVNGFLVGSRLFNACLIDPGGCESGGGGEYGERCGCGDGDNSGFFHRFAGLFHQRFLHLFFAGLVCQRELRFRSIGRKRFLNEMLPCFFVIVRKIVVHRK